MVMKPRLGMPVPKRRWQARLLVWVLMRDEKHPRRIFFWPALVVIGAIELVCRKLWWEREMRMRVLR